MGKDMFSTGLEHNSRGKHPVGAVIPSAAAESLNRFIVGSYCEPA